MSHFEGQTELGNALGRAMEGAASDVEALCREIYQNPETAFSEQRAAGLLTDYLAGLGYQVESGVAGLPTSFVARMYNHDKEAMRKGLRHGHLAIVAEYDAEQEGHLYGRHLVAGAAMSAAVGLAEVLKKLHGDVSIFGCPAASTLEGKRLLAAEGLFEAPDLVLGAFPASTGLGFQSTINSTGGTLASAHMVVRYAGDAGESDARQRLATSIESQNHELAEHDIIRVTLAESGIELNLTSGTDAGIDELVSRIEALAGDAARETGSTVIVDVTRRTPALNPNRVLARRIKTFADRMGLKQDPIVKTSPGQPSDWGHVALVTSTAQARYVVSEDAVEVGTEPFAEACSTPFAYEQMISAALSVALTGLDALGDMEFRGFLEGELIRTLNGLGVKRMPRRWLGVHPVMPRDNGSTDAPPALGPLTPPRRGRS